jgi:hypothetical protein
MYESTSFLTATTVEAPHGHGRGDESRLRDAREDSADANARGASAPAPRPTRITEALVRSSARLAPSAPLATLRSLDLHVAGGGGGRGPIVVVEALDACVGLTALNLSFNAIASLGRGLERLTCLEELNLAENRLRWVAARPPRLID